ncbi:MAG: DUF2029 domain-containing protein [Chloroflexi bacterium]|nr:DUF2029 domain-containing protein [Chloroflexota bacterium]
MKTNRNVLILWSALTGFLLASTAWLNHIGAFEKLIRTGPYSILGQNLASALIVWLLFGLTIYLVYTERLNRETLPVYAGFLLVNLVYINLLRERIVYGDLEYYIDAATQLYKNNPLPAGYLYPPFWAAVLEPFVHFGKPGLLMASWLFNIVSIAALYFLLIAVLKQYGFSSRTAALTASLFLLVNVPALRTLFYGQVNLHMLNFMLLTVVLYPRHRFLSALALAVAVHLKISPVILAFVFLLQRDWRWLFYFGISLLLVGAIPVLTDGISPYYDFLRNSQEVVGVRDVSFREGSIDAIFLALYNLNFIPLLAARILAYAVKLMVAGFAFFVMVRNIRERTFFQGQGEVALNAMPVMVLLLNLASPLVWEHHGIFLALPFLLILMKLESRADWWIFGFAYLVYFLMPTFDYYPWSTAARLSAPLLILWLTYRLAAGPGPAPAFERIDHWLRQIA